MLNNDHFIFSTVALSHER